MSLKVLYLDDEPDLCECFADVFATQGIQVDTFTDPQKAIESALSNPPDLIFLDYRLLTTTGDKVALAMPRDTPIYLVTGDTSIATAYPFEFVFSKPLDVAHIREVIHSYLKVKVAA